MEGQDSPSSVKDSKTYETNEENMQQWTAISLTHVEYIKGDLVGCVLAWCSLLPIFLLVSFVTLILFRRDLHTISFFFGLLINEGVNWTLKHIIREYRPNRTREILFTEYGMPSSHAQFMWFFSTYLVFFIYIRVHHNVNPLDNVWKYVTCIVWFGLSTVVAYSRVYLSYHTLSQVCWGAVVGLTLGGLWFCVVQLLLTPFFPTVAAWPISEYLMVRDSTLIPNVLWFEYTSSRSEARSRQRKLTSRKSQ